MSKFTRLSVLQAFVDTGVVLSFVKWITEQKKYQQRFVTGKNLKDAFRAVLVRFETNNLHWKVLLLLAFSVILLQKL